MINFTVLGDPTAQKRHRHTKVGNFVRNYDPSKADKADFLQMAQVNAPAVPIEGPIALSLLFVFPRPKSHYRTGKNAGILKDNAPFFHTSKPDEDNLSKFVKDALNKVYWRDDSLVCVAFNVKIYTSEKYPTPMTRVIVRSNDEVFDIFNLKQ